MGAFSLNAELGAAQLSAVASAGSCAASDFQSAPALAQLVHGALMTMELSPVDHELWALVRKRVDQGVVMTMIADELGLSVDELCDWIMAYREPRPAKVRDRRSNGPAIAPDDAHTTEHFALSPAAQRMANWRKAQAAAHVARSAK